MKVRFSISNSSQRKQLVSAVSGVTSAMPRYMGMPTMAYQIGECLVEKDGTLVIPDTLDAEGIILNLKIHGFEGEVESQAEATVKAEEEPTVEPTEEAPAEEAEEPETAEEPTVEVAEEPTAETIVEEAEATNEVAAEETPAETTVEEVSAEAEETTVEEAEESTAEPVRLSISFPISKHTSRSIKNLVNLIYSRGALVSKSVQGEFLAPKELVDGLDDKDLPTAKDQVERIRKLEAEKGVNLKGISFDDEKVTFDGFPETTDADLLTAFQHLAEKMNKQAIEQKRIQAKAVDEENEKYALRTWFVRIGMGGGEYKKTRSLLMEHLKGHTAFRTPADAERWKARQAELKAQRKAEQEETAECSE